MAILSCWSDEPKESCQSLSIVAIATYMSVEHNYKTLLIDATFHDDTISRCFWQPQDKNKELKQELNRGKLDIVSGTEGLMSAVQSNKISPEVIANYARVVFNKRLDVLVGLKTKSKQEYEKYLQTYPDLIAAANKYYDMVVVDLPKTSEFQPVNEILKKSDVIMYSMSQNLRQINAFVDVKKNKAELKNKSVIPLLGSTNVYCKYNPKNVASYIKEKNIANVRYNNGYLEAASESKVADFFLHARLSKKAFDLNAQFLESVAESSKKIMAEFEKVKYGKL